MALTRRQQLNHPLWLQKVEEIKTRDGHRCRICGDNMRRLEIHHLCYLPGFLAWEYDNELMVTVCLLHHEQLTYDLPKVSGLIAFEALKGNIDLSYIIELLKSLHV